MESGYRVNAILQQTGHATRGVANVAGFAVSCYGCYEFKRSITKISLCIDLLLMLSKFNIQIL